MMQKILAASEAQKRHLKPGETQRLPETLIYPASYRMATTALGPVCVTGAGGFIASHVVSQLLGKGYAVHGTVRDPQDPKNAHLLSLSGAEERLKLFAADLSDQDAFDAPIAGCFAVIHMATSVLLGSDDGKKQIFDPGMKGMQSVLDSVEKAGTVKSFVLTSSMSAVAPQPEPSVKSEEHWSDPDAQKAKNNWYGATKTCQEKLLWDTVAKGVSYRAVAINPTGVFGPMLQPGINGTMGWLASLCKGSKTQAGNDSMSFVDVRDCAAMHVAGVENPGASGRYMCVVESLHWNDIFKVLEELCPSMPRVAPCDGEPIKPTQFDLAKMHSLGVKIRDVKTILRDALEDLKAKEFIP